MSLQEKVSPEDMRACLELADRLLEKYVLHRRVGAGPARARRNAVQLTPGRGAHPKRRRYGKHNPLPVEVKQRILRRLRQKGAHKMSFSEIAGMEKISTCTVGEVARAAGIRRGGGNWRLAA